MGKKMKRVQAELSAVEYEALRKVAAKEGVSLREALRQAARDWAFGRNLGRDSPLRIAAIGPGGPHSSRDHDEIHDEH